MADAFRSVAAKTQALLETPAYGEAAVSFIDELLDKVPSYVAAAKTVREAGALAALLGGLDLLAFTGGIGEHDAALRAAVVAPLAHLGLRLDAARNAAATGDAVAAIHADDSAAEVWVVPTDEGRVAARAAFALLAGTAGG